MTSHTSLPTLTHNQSVFLQTVVAQVQAMPQCAQACLSQFDSEMADPLQLMTALCGNQVKYETDIPLCIGQTCTTLADQAAATALLITSNAYESKCGTLSQLFTAGENELLDFAPTQSLVRATGTARAIATGTATGTALATEPFLSIATSTDNAFDGIVTTQGLFGHPGASGAVSTGVPVSASRLTALPAASALVIAPSIAFTLALLTSLLI